MERLAHELARTRGSRPEDAAPGGEDRLVRETVASKEIRSSSFSRLRALAMSPTGGDLPADERRSGDDQRPARPERVGQQAYHLLLAARRHARLQHRPRSTKRLLCEHGLHGLAAGRRDRPLCRVPNGASVALKHRRLRLRQVRSRIHERFAFSPSFLCKRLKRGGGIVSRNPLATRSVCLAHGRRFDVVHARKETSQQSTIA